MSWLRTSSLSFARQVSRHLDPRCDYEPSACFNSFCMHWRQAHNIIVKSHPSHLHDDVLAVVNHLEQLSTLLSLEARAREINTESGPPACLEHTLTENLMDQLFEWAACTGKYENAVRLEQLKLYGTLISYYSEQVIISEPFIRPLLKLLSGFRNELPPSNVEAQLVTVLNQLCVCLMQNMQFIDLFFLTAYTRNGSHSEFIIVRLLLPSVHREGRTGSTARDALLLCAKMSARNQQLADYMLNTSNTCHVLATGVSALYSVLPRVLSDKTYRLTPDDVNRLHKLTLFVDSLEFCNATAQVAHSSIKKLLLDLLYQGFLVPIMGPTVLQNRGGALQQGVAEQCAAVAYLELIVRCVTPHGMLRPVLHFLTQYQYDGVRLIDVIVARIDGESQLSLVSLALIETLIDLNSEDVMYELIYKYILNGQHLLPPHRTRISDSETYREAAVSYLGLRPSCCLRPPAKTREWVDGLSLNGRRVLDFRREEETRGEQDGIAMNNLVQEIRINYGNTNETLFGNYHAYLCDARFEIVTRTLACNNWSSKYDTVVQNKIETNNNKERGIDLSQNSSKELDSIISICTSGYETFKNSDTSEKELPSLTSLVDIDNIGITDTEENKDNLKLEHQTDVKEHDSLTSIGESSGYESFRYKIEESDENDGFCEESFLKSMSRVEECEREYDDVPMMKSWRVSAENIIGPLLCKLLKKASLLLESEVHVNVHVTGIISKLVCLPTPLLTALLLHPGFVVQPNVPSLFQILSKLKEEVDELTQELDNSSVLIDQARVFLIQREMALVGAARERRVDHEVQPQRHRTQENQARKPESKRKSLSDSISSMFSRKSSTPIPPTPLHPLPLPPSSPASPPPFTSEVYWSQSITLRSVLNAVLLDEWVCELAALAEEHGLRLTADGYEDEAYIRSVSL